jgi:hypothetical protein
MVMAMGTAPIEAHRRRSGAIAGSTIPSLTQSFRRRRRVSDGSQVTCCVVRLRGRKNGGNYKIDRAGLERKNGRARDRIVTVAHTVFQSTTLPLE